MEDDVFTLQRLFSQVGLPVPLHLVADGQRTLDYVQGTGRFIRRERHTAPDVLFISVNLPVRDSLEVIRAIRSDPNLATMRIVALVRADQIRQVKRAYSAGANTFLVKPIEFRDFKDTIQGIYEYWLALPRAVDEPGESVKKPGSFWTGDGEAPDSVVA